MTGNDVIARAIGRIRPPDEAARDEARALQARLTKPAGALGRLEDLHVWAAGVFRVSAAPAPSKTIVVAAADHGVADDGVSAYPQAVTAQMARNFLAGGAAINVLAAQAGASIRIVDAGMLTEVDDPRVHEAKVRRGSSSMARERAMTRADAETLVARGVEFANAICGVGPAMLGLGDMGIGNTTAAAAVTSVMTGARASVTAGRGTGIDDAGFAAKVQTIEAAMTLHAPDALDPLDVVSAVGGCEIAFLAGVAIGGAASSAAVLLDGYPTTAAALIATAIAPACGDYLLATHLSAEPGHRIALDYLGLQPLLDLGMRLGEGTGAALGMLLLDAALAIPRGMATFESAGVSRAASETQPEG